MKINTTILILLALGMLLCGGCTNMAYTFYDGPRQPKAELAMIKAGVVWSIGGKDISYLANHKIVVMPGDHAVGLYGKTRTASGKKIDLDCSLLVSVEAGHIYEGFIDGESDSLVIGIVDTTADEVVAAWKPHGGDSTPQFVELPDEAPILLTSEPIANKSLARLAASF